LRLRAINPSGRLFSAQNSSFYAHLTSNALFLYFPRRVFEPPFYPGIKKDGSKAAFKIQNLFFASQGTDISR
jgi:hypothetical protein